MLVRLLRYRIAITSCILRALTLQVSAVYSPNLREAVRLFLSRINPSLIKDLLRPHVADRHQVSIDKRMETVLRWIHKGEPARPQAVP